jgi:hypothetical protein
MQYLPVQSSVFMCNHTTADCCYQNITRTVAPSSSKGDPTCSTGIFAVKKAQMITEDGYTHVERSAGSGVCDVSVCCPAR